MSEPQLRLVEELDPHELRRTELQRDLFNGRFAALVRTSDHKIAIPIIRVPPSRKYPDGGYRVRLGSYDTVRTKLRGPGSAVQRAEEIVWAAAGGFRSGADVRTEYPPTRRNRRRHLLAREPVADVAERRFINPKHLFNTSNFVPLFPFLSRLGATSTEEKVYGWLVYKSDTDGVFRHALNWLAGEIRNIDPSSLRKQVHSLERRGLLEIPEGSRKAKEIRFLWVPEMGELSEVRRSSELQLFEDRQSSPLRTSDPQSEDRKSSPDSKNQKSSQRLNQALSRGNESGRYTRDEGEFPNDAAWSDFCRTLAIDMISNGALWAKRWRENRTACVDAMQDFRTKDPEEKAKWDPAKYITRAYMNATRAK